MEWVISALSSVAGLLQRERDKGRVIVEGESGWPAANPYTITGPSIAWVKVTNRTTMPVQVDGLGFMVGREAIPIGNTTESMPAYLPVGRSVTGFVPLAALADATRSRLSVDGAYAHVAGVGRIERRVKPSRLFYPLYVEMNRAA